MSDASNPIEHADAVQIASEIVSAYVRNNQVDAEELPFLLQNVFNAVLGLKDETAGTAGREPAVPIAESVTPDHIVCLEDGKKLKMLKRYLRTHYDLTPEEYRRKWGLPADYPMVAPNYAERRSQFAKDMGLGTTASAKGARAKKRKAASKKRNARRRAA